MYNNYHVHSMYSNVFVADSIERPISYVNRTIQLGHEGIFTGEHGHSMSMTDYYKSVSIANNAIEKIKNGASVDDIKEKKSGLDYDIIATAVANGYSKLNLYYSVEAYFSVEEEEKNMYHIVLIGKNKLGREAILEKLSDCSRMSIDEDRSTFRNKRPKLSLDMILDLPSSDVIITTACVGGYVTKDERYMDITAMLSDEFGENFLLEVQGHNTDLQKEHNKRIIELSKEFGVEMIVGMDSHMVSHDDVKDREAFQQSKGIHYEDEEGWDLDFPSYEVAYKRLADQGILSDDQIERAMSNTMFENMETIKFDTTTRKIPNIHKDLDIVDRKKMYTDLVWLKWDEYKGNVAPERWDEYEEEIKWEVDAITDTDTQDYFLFNYELIRQSVAKGGIITRSGRGSAPSYFTNMLLGFTTIDRISAEVKMFRERFITKERLLSSLPDIDFNISGRELFIETQKELLGAKSVYWMMAIGKLKEKSAFKVYSKSQNVPFDVTNEITKQLTKYEKESAFASESDNISIYDYIDPQYHDIYNHSKRFIGIVDNISPHPCAFLTANENIDILFGSMRVKKEIVCLIEGSTADDWMFTKNDLLNVTVYDVIGRAFKKANIEIMPATELIAMTRTDQKVWDIYQNGYTMGINQLEKDGATKYAIQYAPQNISEVTALIAGIRPGFRSMFYEFIKKTPFDYGIPVLDNLIQTEQYPYSFVLYQENAMSVLNYAGIEMGETYKIIKAISKKKKEVILSYKEQFMEGFSSKLSNNEGVESKEALKTSKDVWQIIEDSSAYSFNASHAYSTAIDSLYGAYLKAHHTYEFYEAMLEIYSEKKDNDKLALIVAEMQQAFDIKLGKFSFGLDNRTYTSDKGSKIVFPSLNGVKYVNAETTNILYEEGKNDYTNFYDVYTKLTSYKAINKRTIETLIKIGYFDKFGTEKKLIRWVEAIKTTFKGKTYKKVCKSVELEDIAMYQQVLDIIVPLCTKESDKLYRVNPEDIHKALFDIIPEGEFTIEEKLRNEMELMGQIISEVPEGYSVGKVVARSHKKNVFMFKSWINGNEVWINAWSKKEMPNRSDIVMLFDIQCHPKKVYGKMRDEWYAQMEVLKKGK